MGGFYGFPLAFDFPVCYIANSWGQALDQQVLPPGAPQAHYVTRKVVPMAKKPVSSSPAKKAAPAKVVASTPVRNSPVPKAAPAKAAAPRPVMKKEITHDDISRRAYEIWASGQGGSEYDNWIRAEKELRGL